MASAIREILSIGLFFQLLVCAVSLAVFMIGLESNPHLNLIAFIMLIGVSVTLTSTGIPCYLSENVTNALEAIGDIFFDCAWYHLPPKQQKLFLLPLQRSQKTFRFTGLGLVECSLGVFLGVGYFSILYV